MANPYEIVKAAKRAGMNPKFLLDRVSICRAFTVYQMSTIIDDKLERELPGVKILIVTGIQYLYQNRDIRSVEAKVMLRRAVGNIRMFTDRYVLISVITDIYREGRRDLGGLVRDVCNRYLRLTAEKNGICVEDVEVGGRKEYRDVRRNQMLLEEFINRQFY